MSLFLLISLCLFMHVCVWGGTLYVGILSGLVAVCQLDKTYYFCYLSCPFVFSLVLRQQAEMENSFIVAFYDVASYQRLNCWIIMSH